ncbi:RIP metalloprotease RseP [Caldimonas tepidiphila]|uniref:RIP metalloprotease RseP n=1 Tax=Caldimonas tepidiphila TaxID=2315841 RepID=UPI000E5BF07A|nr:RIP metalloprotease RseP [Caldimonas tepidiphila]
MLTTVLSFLLTIGILIVVHEWGHYRVARACGVKVLRFSVGFGKVLWRRQRSPDSTEFVLCALPFGGYVRMLDGREGAVPPHQAHMAFNNQPLRARAAIVAAGPAANIVLAVLLYAAANWIGVEEPRALLGAPTAGSAVERAGLRSGDLVRALVAEDGDEIAIHSFNDLRWHLTDAAVQGRDLVLLVSDAQGRGERRVQLRLDGIDSRDVDAQLMQRLGFASPYSEPVLGDVKADGPAARAGLMKGDRVLEVDGRPVPDAGQLREWIRQSVQGGTPREMQWRVQRDGRVIELPVTAAVRQDQGQPAGRIDAYVGTPPQMVKVQHGPLEGLVQGAKRTWDVSVLSLQMLGRMLIGEASLKNLSGPLTIADIAGQTVQLGLAYYLGFLALVSVSLGVLNLLPLPVLDGGHLMYYLFEGVTGRPISDLWLERLQRGGVAVMFMMMSLALYNDVARLLGLQ